MKCVGFLIAVTILCQIVVETNAIRRRRWNTDTSYDFSTGVGVEDHLSPSRWRNSNQQRVSQRDETVSYDSFGIKHGDFSDGARGGDTRIPPKGHTSTSGKGYGGNEWWGSWAVNGIRHPDHNPLPSNTETTLSMRIAECIRSCPVTAEHNPVCGSNNVTYTNPGRLECAQRCGVAVELSRLTACSVPVSAHQVPVDREALVACLRRCSISDEFNPVCGSNNRTYENRERLLCEQRCGIPVQITKLSPCIDPEPVTTQRNEERISACIRSCPVAGEFNPVCGSNNVTYTNPGRLECAQNCGVAVQISRNTSCTAPLPADVTTYSTTEQNQKPITISISERPYMNGNGQSNFSWNNNEDKTDIASGENLNGNKDDIVNVNGQNDNTETSFIGFVSDNSSTERYNINGGNDDNGQEEGNVVNDKNNNTEEKINSATKGNDSNNGTEGKVWNEENNGKPGSKGYHGGGSYGGNNPNNGNGFHGGHGGNNPNSGNGFHGGHGGNNPNSGNGFHGGHGGNNGNHGHGSNSCNGVNNQKTPNVMEVMACMQSCSLTNELNPVCGTDAITYANPGRLLCAQFCGIDVRVKKFASCSSSSTTNYHCPTVCTNPPVTGNIETSTPTSPSPAQACMDTCPISIEFKPVCGSNNITYRNLEQLQCARRCGINVSLQRNTHCSTPAANPQPNGNGIWNIENPNNPTTSKPDRVQECINRCSVSHSYEPICGSDNVTYNNTGHLVCARQCGRDIRVKKLYPCSEDETPSSKPTTEKNPVSPGQNFTISPDVLANIWSETTPKDETDVEEFDLDQRVQDQQ